MVSIRKLKKEIKKLNVHINYSADILRRISRIDPFAPDALEAYYIAKKKNQGEQNDKNNFHTLVYTERSDNTLQENIREKKTQV